MTKQDHIDRMLLQIAERPWEAKVIPSGAQQLCVLEVMFEEIAEIRADLDDLKFDIQETFRAMTDEGDRNAPSDRRNT